MGVAAKKVNQNLPNSGFDVEIPEDLAETFAKELEELTRGALLIEFVEE